MIHEILLQAPFPAYTQNTITTADALAQESAEIRKSGYAWDRGEFSETTWCLAVPICLPDESIKMSLAISGDNTLYDNESIRNTALQEIICFSYEH